VVHRDEMCLITAEIAVNDSALISDRLAALPGFERDLDDPALITWYRVRLPDPQRAGILAEARTQLGNYGFPDSDIEDSDAPQRWVRGTLHVSDGQFVAEVNSAGRLTRLLKVLSKLGADPVVLEETRIDPAQDLAWPGGERARPGSSAPPGEGWEKYWLDEQLPALLGQTPRQAAEGKERPRLEALLRQFEYEADLLAARGQSGIDTAWLRQELDMEDTERDES